MHKKLFYIILVLLIVIFIMGCDTSDSSTTKTGKVYIGGEDGLSVEFDEDAPPDEVMDNSEETFPIRLKVKNDGEYTIPKGGIISSLSGISKDDFDLSSLHATSDFTLRREELTTGAEGDENILDFDDAKFVNDLAADFETTIFADVCYKYKTRAATSICLKKDTVQTMKRRDACDIRNDVTDYENSGAPLQVTSIKQYPGGSNRVTFTFVIENKGDGDCYVSNQFSDKCLLDDESKLTEIDVSLSSSTRNVDAKCDLFDGSSSGTVKLFNGKRTITCYIDTGSLQETAYEGRINIDLDYFYRVVVKKDIIVENAVIN